ncbi:hypothetical protein PR048_010632 [Dryococelus australis]|uniref:Uncharacterized protein n=1 Tax=Dryococelus australis TaxID=614101 RepID=A0ABQ9I3A9_9NEOP|nr:hypothetical protein PR048_010632 [Dryococelus australis]
MPIWGKSSDEHPNLAENISTNERAGEMRDPRGNQPTSGIARHNSHLRKSGVNRPQTEPGLPWCKVSSLTTVAPPTNHNSDRFTKGARTFFASSESCSALMLKCSALPHSQSVCPLHCIQQCRHQLH